MIPFRSQKRLGHAQIGLLIRGLIQDFRRTFPPLSHAESPPRNLPTISFIYPQFLKAFPQNFSTDINPTKYPAKEKKWVKEEGRRELALKELHRLLFHFQNYFEILPSTNARSSEATILHLEKGMKATKCSVLFIAIHWWENSSTM